MTYSKGLGADKDGPSRHSDVVFPFFTSTGCPGRVRSEVQIRVPIDDAHTYHISYFVHADPPSVPVCEQEAVPWFDCPHVWRDGQTVPGLCTRPRHPGLVVTRQVPELGRDGDLALG